MGIVRSDYLPTQNPETQRSTVHQTTDGETVIRHEHDIGGILRANHFQKGEQTLHHQSEIMNHVARIDVLVLKEWCRQRGITKRWWKRLFEDGNKLLQAFLNDPQNEAWRTRKGKV